MEHAKLTFYVEKLLSADKLGYDSNFPYWLVVSYGETTPLFPLRLYVLDRETWNIEENK